MKTNFSLDIKGTAMDFISMNGLAPKIFQVFAVTDGVKKRYHMQGNGIDELSFVNRNDCPQFLLDLEEML